MKVKHSYLLKKQRSKRRYMKKSTTKSYSLKKRLEKNKELIEAFTSLVLGLMGIILSIAAIFISYKANSIAEEQLLISKLENMPLFNLSSESGIPYHNVDTEESGITIVIQNNGGQITNASITAEVVVEYKIRDNDMENGFFVGRGALKGIYSQPWAPYDGNKNTFTLKRNHAEVLVGINEELLFTFLFGGQYRTNTDFVSVSIKEYLRITYTDYHSDVHKELFEVDSRSLFTKVSNTDDTLLIPTDFRTIDIGVVDEDSSFLAALILMEADATYTNYKQNQ